MQTNKKILLTLILLLPAFIGKAQLHQGRPLTSEEVEARAEKDESRLDYHVSLFSGVVSGWNGAGSYMGLAPKLSYSFDDQWKIKAGFAVLSDFGSNFGVVEPVSLAPRRYSNTAVAGAVTLENHPTDKIWWSVRGFMATGSINPALMLYPTPAMHQPGYDLNAYGASASIRYKIRNNNYLDFHFSVVRDRAGSLMPMMFNPWCHPYGFGGLGCPFEGDQMWF